MVRAGNRRPPRMSQGTEPPNTAIAVGRHLFRCQGAVFLRMPLGGNQWEAAGQIILAGNNLFPAQTGQPAPSRARDAIVACHSCPFSHCHQTFLRLPPPPDWPAGCVFLRVPLRCKHRMGHSEVILPCQYRSVGTDRAACTADPDFTMACHSCPFSHCHQTSIWLPGSTASGVKLPFRGCHCRASSGYRVARSVSPG